MALRYNALRYAPILGPLPPKLQRFYTETYKSINVRKDLPTMQATDQDEERDASPTGKAANKSPLTEPHFGRIGEMFKGLAKMTREFEQCPRGSQVVERLIYGGMVCLVLVTYIRYGHG